MFRVTLTGQRNLARRAVVFVLGAQLIMPEIAHGRDRDEQLRLEHPDLRCDAEARLVRIDQLAVLVAEQHRGRVQLRGCVVHFDRAHVGELVTGDGRVARALVAVREHDDFHLSAGGGETRDKAAAHAFVVRMRRDHHDARELVQWIGLSRICKAHTRE